MTSATSGELKPLNGNFFLNDLSKSDSQIFEAVRGELGRLQNQVEYCIRKYSFQCGFGGSWFNYDE